jgi:hypothetical protein
MIHLLPFATVLIDAQTALFAGTIVPLIMIRLLRLQPERETPVAVGLGAAWGLLWSLSVTYMYFKFPDWMLGYVADSKTVPLVPIWFVFVLACVFSGAAGAAVGAFFVTRDKIFMAGLCVFGAFLTWLAVLWPHAHGYSHVGTYAEYMAGKALPSPGPPEAAFGMMLSGLITAPPSIAMIVWIVKRSMKT